VACKNFCYQEFCAQIYQYAPVCDDIDKKNIISSSSYPNNPWETGLVLQMFELGRLFVEKKMVKFSPEGACMYPCIRPKDILHIEPKSVSEIRVGDIAVYRKAGRLFAHRTIAKGNNEGQDYIITRPDTAYSGNDGASFEQDILGIVSRIQRRGETLNTVKKDYPFVKRFFFNLYLKHYYFKQYLWRKIIDFISYIQQYKAYRWFARFLFIKSSKEVQFSLQAPISPKANSKFYKEFSKTELLESLSGEFPVSKWTIALEINSKPAGYLSFVFKPKDCPFSGWWLYEYKLRLRYRRTNLEEKLLREADDLFKQAGATGISVSVLKGMNLEKKILKNLGFREISTQKEVFFKNKEPVERLIMKKEIGSKI
jgi:ribosomal protein S18 acetylase RimI-like enzyme